MRQLFLRKQSKKKKESLGDVCRLRDATALSRRKVRNSQSFGQGLKDEEDARSPRRQLRFTAVSLRPRTSRLREIDINRQLSTTPSIRPADQSRLASHPRLPWCPSFPFSSLLLPPVEAVHKRGLRDVTGRRHFRGACQKDPAAATRGSRIFSLRRECPTRTRIYGEDSLN